MFAFLSNRYTCFLWIIQDKDTPSDNLSYVKYIDHIVPMRILMDRQKMCEKFCQRSLYANSTELLVSSIINFQTVFLTENTENIDRIYDDVMWCWCSAGQGK
jgi:hypothetical protein